MPAPKPITAREALREAYALGAKDDEQAQAMARFLLRFFGVDADIAEAAVIAAFNSHFKVMT